ncbi:Uncharacterised protein [Shigella sonnei]|nr:Uncharacterised protein [Shigella sonnei]
MQDNGKSLGRNALLTILYRPVAFGAMADISLLCEQTARRPPAFQLTAVNDLQ